MITMQGSVPYPPNARSAPIRALATNLTQLSSGIARGSSQISRTLETASSAWTGEAASAFARHGTERARTLATVGTALGRAAPVLQTFAAAIDSTSAMYSTAAVAEQAARAGLPWTAAALAAAIAAETAAVTGLQAAGAACAGALVAIEAEIAAAQFLGVDRSQLDGLKEMAGSIWENVVDLVTEGDTDAAASALEDTTNVVGLVGILGGVAGVGAGARAGARAGRTNADRSQLVELGTAVGSAKPYVDGVANGLGGAAQGGRYAVRRFSQEVARTGTTYRRWTRAARGARFGRTAGEFAELSTRATRWTRALPVASAVVDGAVQYTTDLGNASLTTAARFGRTTAAAALEGGGAWLGATAGAEAGAVAGAAVGAFFGGVGAVPGAVVGGAVGAIGGGIAGSSAGRWVKEQLFAWNPGGVFQ